MNLNTQLIDQKYITQISSRFERFKHKGRGIYSCRCPICRETNTRKSRFYLYPKNGVYLVYCHKCSYSHKFSTFLSEIDNELYREYSLELFLENKPTSIESITKKPSAIDINIDISKLDKISSLHHNHPAKKFITQRMIPSNVHHKLYFTSHFGKWINSIIPNKMEIKTKFDPRIVLLMMDRKNRIVGCQGRTINPKNELRYITIKFDESFPKIFGLETLNPNKITNIVEGPIDSLFISNCIAMTGGDVHIDDLLLHSNINLSKTVFIFDNEPRNEHTVKKIEKRIDDGFNVCIWPQSLLKYGKDINEYVCNGLTPIYIEDIIKQNTFNGLQAKLQLNSWRKDK